MPLFHLYSWKIVLMGIQFCLKIVLSVFWRYSTILLASIVTFERLVISLSFCCRKSIFSLWWLVRSSFCFQSSIISQQCASVWISFDCTLLGFVASWLWGYIYIFFTLKKVWKFISAYLFKNFFPFSLVFLVTLFHLIHPTS